MNKRDFPPYHEDIELFRSALSFTQAETGFSARLIEKDYYCSLLLRDLLSCEIVGLAFKGGTSLNKIHADFYRLSEDLDFAISTPVDASRRDRGKRAAPLKKHLAKITSRTRCFQIVDPLRGYNNSTQYDGRVEYASVVSGNSEYIKIEASVREPILEEIERLPARMLLLDPFRKSPAEEPAPTETLSQREAYAEKLRAALSRRDAAIRDFHDVDHAYRTNRIDTADSRLIDLLRAKMAVPGNGPVDVSPEKFQDLSRQVEVQLKPVLRESDLTDFNLKQAFEMVRRFAELVAL